MKPRLYFFEKSFTLPDWLGGEYEAIGVFHRKLPDEKLIFLCFFPNMGGNGLHTVSYCSRLGGFQLDDAIYRPAYSRVLDKHLAVVKGASTP